MKTHLLRNVGKGPRQFHQGQSGFFLAGFLLSHGRMTTGASALFLLGSGVRTEGLLTKGDNSHPVDLSSSLSRGFFVDERHDIRFIQLGWSVTGPRSAGFGLDLVQQPHPFFTGHFLFSLQNALVGLESNYFVEAYAIAHLTFGGWGPSTGRRVCPRPRALFFP